MKLIRHPDGKQYYHLEGGETLKGETIKAAIMAFGGIGVVALVLWAIQAAME